MNPISLQTGLFNILYNSHIYHVAFICESMFFCESITHRYFSYFGNCLSIFYLIWISRLVHQNYYPDFFEIKSHQQVKFGVNIIDMTWIISCLLPPIVHSDSIGFDVYLDLLVVYKWTKSQTKSQSCCSWFNLYARFNKLHHWIIIVWFLSSILECSYEIDFEWWWLVEWKVNRWVSQLILRVNLSYLSVKWSNGNRCLYIVIRFWNST